MPVEENGKETTCFRFRLRPKWLTVLAHLVCVLIEIISNVTQRTMLMNQKEMY